MLKYEKPDYRELYFPPVGPFLMRYWPFAEYIETRCHRCSWTWYGYFEESAALLSRHLWNAHDPQPKPRLAQLIPPWQEI